MTATCPTCREPRVPLVRCATCDTMACECCLFGPDLQCRACYRASEARSVSVAVTPWGDLIAGLHRDAEQCDDEARRDLAPAHARGMAAGLRIAASAIERVVADGERKR